MAVIRLPYTVTDTDRHGNVRHYVRRKGKPKLRLPGQPGSPEFMAAYQSAVGAVPGRAAVGAGSFRATCIGYYGSTGFRRLDLATQGWQRRALDALAMTYGTRSLIGMRPKHVRKMRDDLADTPAMANQMLKALKSLFVWAIEGELAGANPVREVKPLRYYSAGHHTWTIEEITAFRARHRIGTKARLAMELLLYTTGRREDAVRLGRQHVRHGRIKFTQAKNEHRAPIEIDIPV